MFVPISKCFCHTTANKCADAGLTFHERQSLVHYICKHTSRLEKKSRKATKWKHNPHDKNSRAPLEDAMITTIKPPHMAIPTRQCSFSREYAGNKFCHQTKSYGSWLKRTSILRKIVWPIMVSTTSVWCHIDNWTWRLRPWAPKGCRHTRRLQSIWNCCQRECFLQCWGAAREVTIDTAWKIWDLKTSSSSQGGFGESVWDWLCEKNCRW